jgi:methyl-accepting chemotaxis protein
MLSKLPIRSKIAVIPASMATFLAGLGLYAMLLLSGNEARVLQLNDGVLKQALAAQEFGEATERSLWRLYRLTSIAANETDDKKIAAMVKAAAADRDAYAGGITAITSTVAETGVEVERVRTFEAQLAAYVKAAQAVIEMADSDAGTALLLMSKAQRSFDEASKQVDAFQKLLAESREAQIGAIYAEMARGRAVFAGAIVLVLIAAGCLSWQIARRIAAPIVAMAGAVGSIAAKDYEVTIPALGSNDEIGRMAEAVQVLRQKSIEADDLAKAEQTHAQSAARRAVLEGAIGEFEMGVRSVAKAVAAAAKEITASSGAMSGMADGVARQAVAVVGASEETATNVQSIATASEQLSTSIAEIGRQVGTSTEVASRAVDEARRTNDKMQAMAQAGQKIGDVLKMIGNIAGQINLLALNATIEAARAGDAGRGFVVVASEVKALANQTAKATEDIAAQIAAIQQSTRESAQSIEAIGKTIGEINEIATTIAAAVEEQGAATREMARSIRQASAGTQDVSANIAGVTRSTGEAGAAAEHVRGAADELARQSETLRAQVDSFLTKVRVA